MDKFCLYVLKNKVYFIKYFVHVFYNYFSKIIFNKIIITASINFDCTDYLIYVYVFALFITEVKLRIAYYVAGRVDFIVMSLIHTEP